MPSWWPTLLLVVFVTHMPFFAWRYLRTGERRHAATTVTFLLLIVAYGIRVLAPDAMWHGVSLFEIARVPAWCAAAVCLGMLAHHHAGRWRTDS